MAPRTAIAIPTLRGCIPNPPVKLKGRDCSVCHEGKGSEGLKREVERKMNQRLLKVPMWKARMAAERRVDRTLGVHILLNGNFPRNFFFMGVKGVAGVMGVVGVLFSRSKDSGPWGWG
jgi:hypothetical protein